MFFLPYGLFGGEVADPEVLTREYQRAFRLGSNTHQQQWAADAITSRDRYKQGDGVKILLAQQEAQMFRAGGTLDPNANDPDLTRATGDPDLFHIPYNRGMHEVKNNAGTPLAVEWESAYPEMVFIIVDYQYQRQYTWNQQALWVRTQLQIYLDNTAIPGSGPMAVPINGVFRGTGYGRRSNRSRLNAMSIVPAGPHRCVLMAGQMPADSLSASVLPGEQTEISYMENPPSEGVCLANRKLIVLRFPRAGYLGA